MSPKHEQNEKPDFDDEISLGDLIQGFWRSRGYVVSGLVIGLGGMMSATFATYLLMPQSHQYRQEIALNVGNTYPNGTPFSVNDLRAPVVLQKIYSDLSLQDYGLNYIDFASNVAVSPSSTVYESLVERYRIRLDNPALTYTERQQIENEFSSALGASLSSAATITVTIPGEFNVPRLVAQSVPTAIANNWADIYINQLGVLNFPIPNTMSELVSAEFISSLDYPIAYDALRAAVTTLDERLELIATLAGTNTLSDPESGLTLYDLKREAFNLRSFSLEYVLAPLAEMGINKSPELTIAAYSYRLEELGRSIRLAEESARVLEAALQSEISSPGSVTTLPATAADPVVSVAQPGASGSVVQQFGPDLVDRLIGMSVENASVAFREELVARKLQHQSFAVSQRIERERLLTRLALIRGDVPTANAEILQSVFDEESAKLVTGLNRIWHQADAILSRANVERLGYSERLFTLLPTPRTEESAVAWLSRTTIIAWVMAGFVGAFVGGLVYLISSTLRRRRGRTESVALHEAA